MWLVCEGGVGLVFVCGLLAFCFYYLELFFFFVIWGLNGGGIVKGWGEIGIF